MASAIESCEAMLGAGLGDGKAAHSAPNDNVLVQGVQGSPYAVGFFGYAYFDENEESLIALSIEGVEASSESVDAGTYPLARPLFTYAAAGTMGDKPQVADFLNYYLTHVTDEVVDMGYFPASCEALNASRQAWLDATDQ